MTQYLPPNLLALFAPREPIPFLEPLDRLPWEKKPWPYNGVSKYLTLFEDPSETPAPTRAETREERITRKRQEREDRHREAMETSIAEWDPSSDPVVDGDPFKTLFIGRINYDTSESKLRREFEAYGAIRRITMVADKQGKPRGYAFIEYERERDMNSAYKHADGKKIDGKRVVVDVERGRTVKSWKPRRLGGGLGGTRIGAPHENIKYSGRVDERDMARERDREKDREREGDHGRERRERSRSREKERRHRSRSREKRRRSRSKERERRDRSRSRDRDRKDRDRDNDRRSRKDRDRDRDRDKEKSRDKDKGRDRERDRDKDRSRDKERDRDRDRDRKREREEDDRRESEDYRDKRIRIEGEDRRDSWMKMEGGNPNGNSKLMEA